MPRSGEKRKLFHRRDAEDTEKKFEIRNSKSELPPRVSVVNSRLSCAAIIFGRPAPVATRYTTK
jgi:hypothetical protein